VLLNVGTADLNRGSLSESISRDDRSAALDRATSLLRTASTLDPDNVTIQRNLALALAANDEPRRGRAAADRAKALTSSSNKGDLFQLGRAYVAISAWGEAIRAWQAAEAGPQLIQLGGRLIRARNFEQAINAFVATARIDPDSGGAYDGIARAARERKSTVDETVEELEPLMEAGSPTEYGARLQAARELRGAGRLNEAGAQLRRAEEIGSSPELSLEYGLLWMGAGLPYFAEQVLQRPADDMPYDPESWYWLARAYADAGRHQEAIATIRKGLSRVDPSGQFAPPAERLPQPAAVRAAENKRSERAPLLGVLGESLIQVGRADEAVPALDEAVAALPKDDWLASVQAQARAVAAGASRNLLLNPTFSRSGSWALRPVDWLYRATIPTLWNAVPTIENGQARLLANTPEHYRLAQDVFNLAPEGRYRLSVRLRTEQLGTGTVVVSLVPSGGGEPVRRELRGSDLTDWTTVTLEATPGPPTVDELSPRLQTARTSSLTVLIDLVADPTLGASVLCDEATLVPAIDAR
jgi:tetratricopeptide (TPR) repeat protein